MEGTWPLLILATVCAVGIVLCRRLRPVHAGWLAVSMALTSIIVASANENPLVAAWSMAGLLVALLPIIVRREASAAAAFAIVGAAWIGSPAVTALLWFAATCRRHPPVMAAGVLIPLLALTAASTTQANPAAFASVILIAVVMAIAVRPMPLDRMAIGSPVLLAVLLGQLRVGISTTSLPEWALGAGIMPAAIMLFVLGGGRGLRAVSMDDVLAAAMAVAGGAIVVAGAAAATVATETDAWLLTILSTLATYAALVAMRPRPLDASVPETLDFLAGQGPRLPIRMGAFSLLLLSLVTCVPLANGWTWLNAASETLTATRTEPQPAYLLIFLALVGPIVLAPIVFQVLIAVWIGESRGTQVRFRAMAWSLAAVAIAGPIAAVQWLARY